MINVAKMYAEARKFADQKEWEQAVLDLGYTIKQDVLTDPTNGKQIITLHANAPDGSGRGMFMCHLNKWDMKVRGFLLDKPMCDCGHNH